MSFIKGMDGWLGRLQKDAETAQLRAEAASEKAAHRVLARAQELVPVDTGELKDSGLVVPTENGAAVEFTAPHAVPVHEDLTKNHPRGGQAKFLERAMQEEQDGFGDRFGDDFDSGEGGGA